MLRLCSVIAFILILSDCLAEELTVEARDSYIDAYQESHGSSAQKIVPIKNERQSNYPPYFDNNDPGQFYTTPEHNYPAPNYGSPMYGPPDYIPSFPAHIYGVPYALKGLLDKLKLKLDIYTILKIILKLVIFKKIVKFIALICLLLFIPKFKLNKDENESDDMESRAFDHNIRANVHIDALTQYVLDSLEKYSNYSRNDGSNSTIERIFYNIDNKFSYQRLLSKYFSKDI